MIVFKEVKFSKGSYSLAEFKKYFSGHLKGWTQKEIKGCYNLVNEPIKIKKQRKKSNSKQS